MRRIGPYEIEEELGRGASGTVFRAVDTRDRRPLAVKVMNRLAADERRRQRFVREVEALRLLAHPGLVQLVAAGVEEDRPYVVMELVRGESLEERLHRSGPLPQREAAELVARLARAIAFAHERGVVHRDLKPANVLLGPDGPKIADFGLARLLEEENRLSQTGDLLGTPGYLAPEQARGLRDTGPATDIYGLGALLYAALTGEAPFHGSSTLEVLVATDAKPAERPSRVRPGLSPAIDAACLRCLAKEPAARFPTAAALAAELERLVASGRPRSRALVPLAAALAVAVAIGVTLASRRSASPVSSKPPRVAAAETSTVPSAALAPVPTAPPVPRGWIAFAAKADLVPLEQLEAMGREARFAYIKRIKELANGVDDELEAASASALAARTFRVIHGALFDDGGAHASEGFSVTTSGLLERHEYKVLAMNTGGASAVRSRFRLERSSRGALRLDGLSSGLDGLPSGYAAIDIECNGAPIARCWCPRLGRHRKQGFAEPPTDFDLGRLAEGENEVVIRLSAASLSQYFIHEVEILLDR